MWFQSSSFFKKNLFIYIFYFWLHWVFIAALGLSLVAASGGYSLLWCAGFSLQWLLLLRSTGSRCMGFSSCGSRALERRLSSCGARLSCFAACGIFLDQGSNPCPLHWQADSFFKINLFIYFWLCWVFVSVWGLSLVAVSGGHSSSRCAGLSLLRPLLLRSTGSRRAGSVVVAHRPSCSVACGIFPDQGSNPCPLHWQVDS